MRSVKFPAGPTLYFRKALRTIVRGVLDEVDRVVRPALEQFAYIPPDERVDASDIDVLKRIRAAGKPSKTKVKTVLKGAASKVDGHVEREIERIGISLPESAPEVAGLVTGWIKENTSLITSLLDDQVEKVATLLETNQNRRVEALSDQIQDLYDVTESKADLLARDQTLKLNAQITEARQTAAGIEEYIWTTSGDERVRETHADLDGQKCRWDEPPITNDNGDRNNPGEDYQCRCTAFPVLPELSDEDG